MKRVFAVLFLAFLIFLLPACQVAPDAPEPSDLAELLEFPGLQWNTRPSEVKKALSLQDDDLLEIPADNSEEMLSTDYYLIPVKGEALGELFGGKVKYAHFHCYDNHTGENKGNYGLGLIRVYYEDDTDMAVVRQAVTERYGAESPSKHFYWNPYPGDNNEGTVILDMEDFRQKQETQLLTSVTRESTEHSFYWGSKKMQGDYVTGEIKDAYFEKFKEGDSYKKDENFTENFETMLKETNAVTISIRDGAPSETMMQEDGTPMPTSKCLVFDARQLTFPMQTAGDWVDPIS